MSQQITVRIPHALGQAEAQRRIEAGFSKISQQLSSPLMGLVKFQHGWTDNKLVFSGGTLGQMISGRISVYDAGVAVEIDLPPILAALRDQIAGKMKNQTQSLLK